MVFSIFSEPQAHDTKKRSPGYGCTAVGGEVSWAERIQLAKVTEQVSQ